MNVPGPRASINMTLAVVAFLIVPAIGPAAPSAASSLPDVIEQAQAKVVKIYGAGGFQGLQAYQTGIVVSPEGHVLTVLSHVLDTSYITVVGYDGRRFNAQLLGADPWLEIALLKIDATDLPHFDLGQAVAAEVGTRVIALSNLFGVAMGNEPASAQRGTIAARASLQARRGQFETPYRGLVYVLDVTTNNPGAGGGVLLDARGRLLGILGKELRNAQNHTWLNYALPVMEIEASVAAIQSGRFAPPAALPETAAPDGAVSLERLGIRLVPNVLDRTPPFVESVREGSPAAAAGIRPDDLVLLVDDQLVRSCAALGDALRSIDPDKGVRMTLLRGAEVPELSEVVLQILPDHSRALP